jgi:ubiquinone/menaquinone biosynthesis C-methylase UbiE
MTTSSNWELYYQHVGGETFYEMAGRYLFARRHVVNRVVLDAACGMGYGTALLAEKAKRIVGIDRRRHAIAYCRANHKRSGMRFVQMDYPYWGLCGESFDVVVLFESPGPVSDIDLLLKEINRVLKPGGALFIAAANPGRESVDRVIPARGRIPLLRFTVDELHAVLSKHFTVESIWGQGHFSVKDLVLLRLAGVNESSAGPDSYFRRSLRAMLRRCASISVHSRKLLLVQVWAHKFWVGEVEPALAFSMIAKAVKQPESYRAVSGTPDVSAAARGL